MIKLAKKFLCFAALSVAMLCASAPHPLRAEQALQTQPEAQPQIGSTTQPQNQATYLPAKAPAQTLPDPDSFIPGEGGYALYQNSRYGTFISFPLGYFIPDPAPDSGDGRRFVSADGAARFYVFAQFNALGQTQGEQIAADKASPAHGSVSYESAGPGWYVLSGITGSEIYYRRVIEDSQGLIQVFEITYPAARKTEFDAMVSYMAKSFGPGSDQLRPTPPAKAGFPPVRPEGYHMPARGSEERAAIIEAARPGAAEQIGRHVIFVVQILRTDGNWAFMQARPVNPDGSPLSWATTPFADEIRKGVMSDVYMALLIKRDGRWRLLEAALGPTDVAWMDWLAPYNLPKSLFNRQ